MNTPFTTAASGATASPPRARSYTPALRAARPNEILAAEAAFVAFLLLAFIGTSPFPTPTVLGVASAADSGSGDTLRQAAYLVVFSMVVGTAFLQRGWRAFASITPLFGLLLGWCMLSTLWSIDPAITSRRAILAFIVAASAMLSVETVGPTRSLALLRIVLAWAIVICWISLPLIPQARHLANDFEPGVAGNWRGLYTHKNIAGAICANAAMIFLYFALKHRRLIDILLFLAAVGFLVGTSSKSSLGLLPVALFAGVVYRFASKSRFDGQIVAVAAALVVSVVGAGIVLFWDTLVRLWADPTLFTGRAAIWQAELAYIADHPLLGSGFGSFAYTGHQSPIHSYISAAWVGEVANGHNGFLELLVTIGIPGFMLAILSLFVQPARWLAKDENLEIGVRALLTSLFAFFWIHNCMETNFLKTDDGEWVVFLLAVAILKSSRTTTPRLGA